MTNTLQLEPFSLFFHSHRLKLHYWDYGCDDKPPMVLVHGGLDHARSWDWVAGALRDDYPLTLVGHSLGGVIALAYAGAFPDTVRKVVAIEGMGPPATHNSQKDPYPDRLRRWIERLRKIEAGSPRTYKDLDAAATRMREANPHLSEEMARHLTLHGSKRNPDGSYVWKFDPFVRGWAPYGFDVAQAGELHQRINCPVLLFRGMESWASDPEKDGRAKALKDYRLINVPDAGHWLHHDQLNLFLRETTTFLAE